MHTLHQLVTSATITSLKVLSSITLKKKASASDNVAHILHYANAVLKFHVMSHEYSFDPYLLYASFGTVVIVEYLFHQS